jgi:hypothetical protein
MGLDLYEVFLDVEQEFEIQIRDDQMQSVENVGDMYNVTVICIREQHPERFAAKQSYDELVWEHFKDLLGRQLGLKPEQVVKSARFFHELGFK